MVASGIAYFTCGFALLLAIISMRVVAKSDDGAFIFVGGLGIFLFLAIAWGAAKLGGI